MKSAKSLRKRSFLRGLLEFLSDKTSQQGREA